MVIKLLRHGESAANTGEVRTDDMGDHMVPLTARGVEQARAAGRTLGQAFIRDALVYSSPYRRARETRRHVFEGAGLDGPRLDAIKVYEDARLREVDHGYGDVEGQQVLRKKHGWFYYRYEGGESPADCFDRTSGFLESMLRQAERKDKGNVLIVTHGLTIRCFVMRFLHLTVEDFERMANPGNCDIIAISPRGPAMDAFQFRTGSWGVTGLRLHET